MNKLTKLITAGTLALFAASAYALPITVNDENDDFTIDWSHVLNGGKELSAEAFFDVTSVSNTQIVFEVDIKNDTKPDNFQAAIVSLGFYIDPDATGASITNVSGGANWSVTVAQPNFPGGYNSIDVCIYAANNCQGGNINKGLQNGASDSFTLTLLGSFTNGLVFPADETGKGNFPIKFQTEKGSYEFNGQVKVPEPATLGLLGLGLLGLGAIRRRKLA